MHRSKKVWWVIAIAGPAVLAAVWISSRDNQGTSRLPEGAVAGDFSAFTECVYDGADARGTDLAECGTLVVPENRDNPSGRLLALPIIRLPAGGSDPLEPVFFLEGGPGQSNLGYSIETPRLYENHDIVLVGYRGVDDAMPLDCPEWGERMVIDRPLAESSRPALEEAVVRCARRLQEQGIDLSHYTMFDVIEDLEDVRQVLGYDQINLHSNSYGTRLAQYYARIHPASIKRSALFGLNPPGHFRWFPEVTDKLLRDYSDRCAEDEYCRSRTDDLAATVLSVLSASDNSWLGLSVNSDKLRLANFFMMMNRSTSVLAFDALTAAAHGDMSGIYLMAKIMDLILPGVMVWGDTLSKAGGDQDFCASEKKLQEFVASRRPSVTSLGSPMDLLFASGCRWPAAPYEPVFNRVVRDETESLLVTGNLDASTPLVFAETELLPFLPNGALITLTDFGHEEWKDEQPQALDHLLTVFYRSGEIDASLYRHEPVPFEVGMGLPFFAKAALAVLIVLLLLLGYGGYVFVRRWWMAH